MTRLNKKVKIAYKKRKLKNHLLRFELLAAIAILIFATYILTPRFWEPSGESWRQWAAARVLRETGKFPVLSLGPLYIVYIQLFEFLNYPLSIQVEYIVTHLFVYVALFLMLRRFIPDKYALLITCAWIPTLATIESGGALAGVGLFSLYLMSSKDSFVDKEYFPVALIAAVLSSTFYVPFLVGHVLAVFVKRWQHGNVFVYFPHLFKKRHIVSFLIKFGLVMLVILVVSFPSHRWDNNQAFIDPSYSPVSLNNNFVIAFFQIGTWKEVTRNVPEQLWIYQDWYFTKKKIYGDATTIFQAALNNPKTFIINVLENMKSAVLLPFYFFTGTFLVQFLGLSIIPLIIISWVLFLIGLLGLVRSFRAHNLQHLTFSLSFGAVAVVCSLLLLWLGKRYVVPALLPIFLLVICHFDNGIKHLLKIKFKKTAIKYTKSIIFVSAILVLLTSWYPHGKAAQIKAVVENKAFLSGGEPVSMVMAHKELLKSLDKNTKVLALEDAWIKSFDSANLDNVYNIFGLPPFADYSGKTEKLLDSLDVIWVSYRWSTEKPSESTQSFLRYKLHVKPFLEKKLSSSWTSQSIEGYGKIYRKTTPNK